MGLVFLGCRQWFLCSALPVSCLSAIEVMQSKHYWLCLAPCCVLCCLNMKQWGYMSWDHDAWHTPSPSTSPLVLTGMCMVGSCSHSSESSSNMPFESCIPRVMIYIKISAILLCWNRQEAVIFEYPYFMSSPSSQIPQRDYLNCRGAVLSPHIFQGPQSRGLMSHNYAKCLYSRSPALVGQPPGSIQWLALFNSSGGIANTQVVTWTQDPKLVEWKQEFGIDHCITRVS